MTSVFKAKEIDLVGEVEKTEGWPSHLHKMLNEHKAFVSFSTTPRDGWRKKEEVYPFLAFNLGHRKAEGKE